MTLRTIAILVVAAVAGVGVGFSTPALESTAGEAGPTGSAADLQLDDVPGFGRTTAAMNRDDQVAAYQAYLREKSVAECMAAARWHYRINLQYPVDTLVEFRLTTPADTGPAPTTTASTENRRYLDSLSPDARDGYYQTLLGESAKDVEYVEGHDGLLPAGQATADAFGKGGCVGAALSKVGRIWDLRDALLPALTAGRSGARTSPNMVVASAEFAACASALGQPGIDGPWSIDALAASGKADVQLLVKVEAACTPAWSSSDSRSRAEVDQEFVRAHEDELAGQVARYGKLMEESADDSGFAETVADEIVLGGA